VTDLELIGIQAETLFRLDAAGRMVATNEPGGARPGPVVFLGRTSEGDH